MKLGQITFNGTNSAGGGAGGADLTPLITAYQVATCAGVPVGSPVQALQVIAVNKQQVSVCNTDDIVGTYNTPVRNVLTDGMNLVIAADTAHSMAFKVISGTGTISINGGTAQVIAAGEADAFTASRLLSLPVIIVCTAGKIVINQIIPDVEI